MIRSYKIKAVTERFFETIKNPSAFPFSFIYNGKSYNGLGDLSVSKESINSSEDRETAVTVLSLDNTLLFTVTAVHYPSHAATEWRLDLENISSHDSGVIEDIRVSFDFRGENPVLCGCFGDHENYYRPYSYDLSKINVNFNSDSGRATHINFPYFNLEYGTGGALLAIGWAGTWNADFKYDGNTVTYTANSVNGLKTYFKPGEKIRTASFLVVEYSNRKADYATNVWRDWFVKYNLPKCDAEGNSLKPFSTCCLALDTGLPNSDGSISERYTTWRPSLEKMIAENVKVDFRWFDAGWYITPDKKSCEPYVRGRDWWDTVGTWELDPEKWPEGTFRKSTDFARENGMKTLVWFEPERVTSPEELEKNFGYNKEWAISMEGTNVISNNIGNPDCFNWITERICRMLRENKVEMYREDNNGDPARLWAYLDGKENGDRHGITECKFIDAHYRMWDKIIDCTLGHNGCGFVDSCASGGGRNDLESMKRGIPLLRSDHDRLSTAIRLSMTSTFNKWIPFCGANTREKVMELAPTGVSDVYIWRASYLPILNVDSQFAKDPSQNFDILRFGLSEWKEVNPYLLKEFYTFTPWHSEHDKSGFTAYSYFDAEAEKGVLFVFRQEECAESDIVIPFGFTDGREITLTDKDNGNVLTSEGCTVSLSVPEKRCAKLYFYTVNE